MKRVLLVAAIGAMMAVFAAPGFADVTILGTEDPVDGIVVPIATASPAILVASDGESAFDPFGAGFDTSDGIRFTAGPGVWVPDPAYAAAFAPGFWTLLSDGMTWVLPSNGENGTLFEPVAKWDFAPGGAWAPGTPPVQVILESDGSLSDVLYVMNNGPGGSAAITFSSDPNLLPIPEPSSMAIFGVGIAALSALRLRKKSG